MAKMVEHILSVLRQDPPFDNQELFASIAPYVPKLVTQLLEKQQLDQFVDPSGLFLAASNFVHYLRAEGYSGPISDEDMTVKLEYLRAIATNPLAEPNEAPIFLQDSKSPLSLDAQWLYLRKELTHYRLLVVNPSAYLPVPH